MDDLWFTIKFILSVILILAIILGVVAGFVSLVGYNSCHQLVLLNPTNHFHWDFWNGCLVQTPSGFWVFPSNYQPIELIPSGKQYNCQMRVQLNGWSSGILIHWMRVQIPPPASGKDKIMDIQRITDCFATLLFSIVTQSICIHDVAVAQELLKTANPPFDFVHMIAGAGNCQNWNELNLLVLGTFITEMGMVYRSILRDEEKPQEIKINGSILPNFISKN